MKNYCKLTCRGVTLFWSSRKWYMAILRIIFLVTSIVLILIYLIGPIAFLLNPDKRRSYLISAAPALSQTKTEQLSPLAKKLKYHVEVLAEKIGERAYGQKSQGQARDYIKNQFQKFGYSVKLMKFEIKGLPKVFGESSFYNIEIILGSQASLNRESGIWVIGAHYDTAVGTPGADDNASGVAVLIELASLLKNKPLKQEIRLVAFSSEEPPSFLTSNMGSYQCVRNLKKGGVKVQGVIVLEMLGYYNSNPKSQLYPPFLHLFFPNKGNYIGLVSNFASRKLLRTCKKAWKSKSDFPLECAVLPSRMADFALSDQLNFWAAGYPALMMTDTAFFRNPHYHQPTDTPDKLDYEKMAIITETLASMLEGF